MTVALRTSLAERGVPSTNVGTGTPTVVPVSLEDREIVVAQGAQFTNAQLCEQGNTANMIPIWVKKKLPEIEVAANDTITYTSSVQKVRFKVRFVTTKGEFKAACETSGLHVVYSGHARYGRGPCFGPETPGEHWAKGTGSGNDGIWGMGYPFLPVEEDDIIHHGYTCKVVLAGGAKPPLYDCHPEIRAMHSSLTPYGKEKLKAEILPFLDPRLGESDKIWAFKVGKDVNLVARAGWSASPFLPDLGATGMRCRVFCHFGCSTLLHNQPVLRKLKGWTRSGDEHHAYFTTNSTYDDIEPRWIYYLFKYNQPNAFKPWGPSLQYALDSTNRDLRNIGRNYQLR